MTVARERSRFGRTRGRAIPGVSQSYHNPTVYSTLLLLLSVNLGEPWRGSQWKADQPGNLGSNSSAVAVANFKAELGAASAHS